MWVKRCRERAEEVWVFPQEPFTVTNELWTGLSCFLILCRFALAQSWSTTPWSHGTSAGAVPSGWPLCPLGTRDMGCWKQVNQDAVSPTALNFSRIKHVGAFSHYKFCCLCTVIRSEFVSNCPLIPSTNYVPVYARVCVCAPMLELFEQLLLGDLLGITLEEEKQMTKDFTRSMQWEFLMFLHLLLHLSREVKTGNLGHSYWMPQFRLIS